MSQDRSSIYSNKNHEEWRELKLWAKYLFGQTHGGQRGNIEDRTDQRSEESNHRSGLSSGDSLYYLWELNCDRSLNRAHSNDLKWHWSDCEVRHECDCGQNVAFVLNIA